MSFSLRTHHYEKRGSQMTLAKITPYIRISSQGSGVAFLQKGNVYAEGGEKIMPVPAWVFEQLRTLKPAYRAVFGFTDEQIERLRKGDVSPEEPASLPPAGIISEPEWTPPARALTSEEAETYSFQQLKAYGAQYDLTSNSRDGLLAKLMEEGYVH